MEEKNIIESLKLLLKAFMENAIEIKGEILESQLINDSVDLLFSVSAVTSETSRAIEFLKKVVRWKTKFQ